MRSRPMWARGLKRVCISESGIRAVVHMLLDMWLEYRLNVEFKSRFPWARSLNPIPNCHQFFTNPQPAKLFATVLGCHFVWKQRFEQYLASTSQVVPKSFASQGKLFDLGRVCLHYACTMGRTWERLGNVGAGRVLGLGEQNIDLRQNGEIILYQPDSSIRLEVRMEEETVWLTQAQMADLFQKDRSVITRHINNIFLEKELDKKSNVHFLHVAHSDKPVKYYSLDVIISVGYRVKSLRGTQFRKWANGVIKEYMLRGFAIQQRLKQTEERIDRRLIEHDKKIERLTDKVDFFVRTALPPVEGVFFFDVHLFTFLTA